MQKTLRSALLGTAVGAIALAACDVPSAQKPTASQPIAAEAIPPSDTLVDVVRKSLAHILRGPDPYSRARQLGTLLPTLGKESVPAVAQTLADPMLDIRGAEIELLMRFWATQEPEAAANWAKEEAQLTYRDVAVASAISAWAERDPQAAASYVWPWAEVDEEGVERIVPIALVGGWFTANDPPALRKFISDLPAGIPQQRAIAAYVKALIQAKGTGAAQRWAQSLPDKNKDFKQAVYRRVVDAVAILDIEAAKRWCETECTGPYGGNMRNLISRNWVMRDGPAAMAWLATAPANIQRDIDVQLTYALWSRTDREAALAWIEPRLAGEPEAWIRPLFQIYAQLLAGEKPVEAMQWAEKTDNPQERELTMIGVARVWRYLDTPAAEAWLAQSPLSDEAKEKARAPLPEMMRPHPKS